MDEVTRRVVGMYNHYPYPTYGNHGDYFRRFIAPSLTQIRPLKKILEAGCGTGCVTLDMARHLPSAEIVAFDLTDASLGYARELMARFHVKNVVVQKRNFLDANEDLRGFDFVLSMGVIHHLSNPEKGVEQLYDFLRPGGYAYVYLYATLGRQRLHQVRAFIETLGANTMTDIERSKLAIKAQKAFSYSKIVNTLIEYKKSYDPTSIVRFIAKKALRRLKEEVKAGAKGTPQASKHMVAVHDVVLHPHDVDYRVEDIYNLFTSKGFEFVKVVQGMPDSVDNLKLPSEIRRLAAGLPKVKQYRLIELLVEPRGIGFLLQKPNAPSLDVENATH